MISHILNYTHSATRFMNGFMLKLKTAMLSVSSCIIISSKWHFPFRSRKETMSSSTMMMMYSPRANEANQFEIRISWRVNNNEERAS